MIPVFQPTFGPRELRAVGRVFRDRWPGVGPRVKAFREAFAEYIQVDPAELIAVTSCTEGLFQSIAALELPPTAEVIMPTVSFVGAAHAVRSSGAKIRFCDVDPRTLNPRAADVARELTSRTRAIVVLHYGGNPGWIEEIATLARQEGLYLIEDAACALGASKDGRACGIFGDIGVWSFDAMKLLVTGDGGMIRVGDEKLRQKIFDGVHLGGVRSGLQSVKDKQEAWWVVDPPTWGRRAFMNDMAAAVGLVQLERIYEFLARRTDVARAYDIAFERVPWIDLPGPLRADGVPYFYWIQTSPELRNDLAASLVSKDIYVTFRYWPLHRTRLYGDGRPYPGADRAADTTLLLPLHQNLKDDEVERVVAAVQSFRVR